MEEALAQLMQGSDAAELILPQPAVLTSASQVRMPRQILTSYGSYDAACRPGFGIARSPLLSI